MCIGNTDGRKLELGNFHDRRRVGSLGLESIQYNGRSGTMNSSRFIITVLLFAFSAMSYFDRTIMSIAGPALIQEFQISPTEMGSVYSAFILGYAILMIPGGWLTDRLGPRRTLLIMGASSAVLTGMTFFGAKPGLGSIFGIVPAMFLIRLVLGFVTAPLYPACARTTANWIPLTQHARVQGFVIAGSSVGAAVSPVVFVWLWLALAGAAHSRLLPFVPLR